MDGGTAGRDAQHPVSKKLSKNPSRQSLVREKDIFYKIIPLQAQAQTLGPGDCGHVLL